MSMELEKLKSAVRSPPPLSSSRLKEGEGVVGEGVQARKWRGKMREVLCFQGSKGFELRFRGFNHTSMAV